MLLVLVFLLVSHKPRMMGNYTQRRKLLRETRAILRRELQMERSNHHLEKTHVATDLAPTTAGMQQDQEWENGKPGARPAYQIQSRARPGGLPARSYQYQV
ncbi:hypothetical protein LSH36_100g03001 [Paralvinella palmiformis]|uniref:Uncharacterized protein n=1 Tax=Paralvinella palmiformis TaxID=53620 RepID=A0AAD9N9Y5_9ANNE|nr:hypothetical protein LSH36_100g03001 [Paralvinella palmiformis]